MRVILTAGGTGGHIIPAISIADAIVKKVPDADILFVGTDRGMEKARAEGGGYKFMAIKSTGIKDKDKRQIFSALSLNIRAFYKAIRILRGFRPDWAIGTGGYVTGMVILAARLIGARCAIQEQNTLPGLTNRILGKISHKIFLAFPDTKNAFPVKRTIVTGNPIRESILNLDVNRQDRDSILIMGGSLGARSINTAAVEAIKICKTKRMEFGVVHLSGTLDFSLVNKAYADAGMQSKVYDFIDDMASVYKRACLAVCRAGGITLSELASVRLPAIIVPYPYSADNHQWENASYIASHGGGWVIEDGELSPGRLACEIEKRLSDKEGLKKASRCMGRLCLGDAASRIAGEILGV